MELREPFRTAAEAWKALEDQRGMGDGEVVDLWHHQLQTAEKLRLEGADDELVVAGLLHDLGDARVSEAEHAPWAARLVRPLLGERVAYLIGAHADAKRYICTVEKDYWDALSPVSQQTMLRQGGLMNPAEVEEFKAHPWAEDALRLRRCDDAGKNPQARVADPQYYRAILERVAAAHNTKRER
jgi:predicted HD phosphohydrolase